MNNKCINPQMDIEEEYDMVPMSQESMYMQNCCMMPGMEETVPMKQYMNPMGPMPCMQGVNPMQYMQPMGPMPCMQGVDPMQYMNPMGPMPCMQGVDPMQHMQPMGSMQCMQEMNPMEQMHCMQGVNPMQMSPMNNIMHEDDISSSDSDECGMRGNERYKPQDVDRILRQIERYNPGVFRLMRSYGVPYPVAVRICRRIINLTLQYYESK